MEISPEIVELLRSELGEQKRIVEKRMFGGLCFMMNGNMLCGTLVDGAIYGVGKARQAEAFKVPGAAEMSFTGHRMGGFAELRGPAFADAQARRRLLDLCLEFVAGLPPK